MHGGVRVVFAFHDSPRRLRSSGGGCSLCLGILPDGGLFSGSSAKLGIRLVTLASLGIGLFILTKLDIPKLAKLLLSGLFIKPNSVG